jgi:hypothetical protein
MVLVENFIKGQALEWCMVVIFLAGVSITCGLAIYYGRKLVHMKQADHRRDKLMKQILLKYESCCQLNADRREENQINKQAMLTKALYRQHIGRIKLCTWEKAAGICKYLLAGLAAWKSILCVILGENEKLVFTIGVGVYLFVMYTLVEGLAGREQKKQLFMNLMIDYMEHISTVRQNVVQNEKEQAEAEKGNIFKENAKRLSQEKEQGVSKDTGRYTDKEAKVIHDILNEYL